MEEQQLWTQAYLHYKNWQRRITTTTTHFFPEVGEETCDVCAELKVRDEKGVFLGEVEKLGLNALAVVGAEETVEQRYWFTDPPIIIIHFLNLVEKKKKIV